MTPTCQPDRRNPLALVSLMLMLALLGLAMAGCSGCGSSKPNPGQIGTG